MTSSENSNPSTSGAAQITTPTLPDAGTYVADSLTRSGIVDVATANTYGTLFSKFVSQHGKKGDHLPEWSKVEQPGKDVIIDYEELLPLPNDERLHEEILKKVAIVKLNGGVAAGMGSKRLPTGAIPIRGGQTLLDMSVRQVELLNAKHSAIVPLILLDSFATHAWTVRSLQKYHERPLSITCAMQSAFPRLDRDTYTPLPIGPFSLETEAAWYSPGHGDVYRALDRAGVLDSLLESGVEYVFISNVDNLGATLDLRLLYHLMENEIEFASEVTERTRQDQQGGTLVRYCDRISLLESTQVPNEHIEDFKNIRKFSVWCTNNLWISTHALKEAIKGNKLNPPIIVNERIVSGRPVIELETAAGAVVECFSKAIGVRVPRSRFYPVKTTSDLLAVQSDLFEFKHGTLNLSPIRTVSSLPMIKLGPEFQSLESYTSRIPSPPSLVELDHLTVSGNVYFGEKVTLRGSVVIVADDGGRLDIPPASVLENKIVTGSLRILEH